MASQSSACPASAYIAPSPMLASAVRQPASNIVGAAARSLINASPRHVAAAAAARPELRFSYSPRPVSVLSHSAFLGSRVAAVNVAAAARSSSAARRTLVQASAAAPAAAKRSSKIDVIKTLQERGLVFQLTDAEMGAKLNGDEPVTVYAGFDPTADSLHLGNLVAIMALAHFQRAGHRPIAIVGGATGLIGDPSGRKTERDLLGVETIEKNLRGIEENLSRFMKFEPGTIDGVAIQPAKIINNMSWYEDKNVVQFIREVGKHFRLSTMLNKDSVRIRLEQAEEGHDQGGMSFTEFTYQIFQAYDFMHLARAENCRVQVGGSDQWGNITAGTELIRKVLPGTEAFGLTLPLMTTANGEKFGKSAGNAIWLDEEKTSCYELFQYFLRSEDADAGRFLKVFTFLPLDEIDAIIAEHEQAPEKRHAQRILAEQVTRLIHGEAGVAKAQRATNVLFGNEDLRGLSAKEVLGIFKDVPSAELSRDQVVGKDVVSVVAAAKACPSKGEARRLIQNGGLYLNNEKVTAAEQVVGEGDLVDGSIAIVRTGKKNFRVIRVL
eukprot:tig00001388_g8587.t1